MIRPTTLLLWAVLYLVSVGCRQNPSRPAEATDGTPVDARTRVPDSIGGMKVTRVEPIEGELRDFGDADLGAKGRAQAELEATADSRGFGGVNPCELITPSDLADWPGGLPRLRTSRENVGVIVLGCNYADGTRGRVRLFLSDNASPEAAQQSVRGYLADASAGATAVAGWDGLAAYAAKSGDFVWSRGPVFVNLVVDHPDLNVDRARWARRLAEAVDARLPR